MSAPDDPLAPPPSATPLRDAIAAIPHNQLSITAGASQRDGTEAAVTFERERGRVAGGASASISERQGWRAVGFVKWMLGGKP